MDLAVNVKVTADLSCPDNNIMESLFIQLSHNNLSVKDIIIGVVYRRPETNLTNFNEHFAALLETINLESRPTYILGDFNIDLLNSNIRNQLFFNDLLSSRFFPSIDCPTRITDDTATLIDNIFVNNHNNQTKSGVWLTDIADHMPTHITLLYANKLPPLKKTEYISERKYTEESIANFNGELSGD